MSSPAEIATAIATALTTNLAGVSDLQVTDLWNNDPTPPSIDVYPGDPFQEPLSYGGSNDMTFTVRARVTIADQEGGQRLLLDLMDPSSDNSLAGALFEDPTLGGKVDDLAVTGPSGFGAYADAGGQGSLLGCTWSVRVLP